MGDEALRQLVMKLVWRLGGGIAGQIPLPALLQELDDGLAELRPIRETFEREQAERWLEVQAKALKPPRPRALTSGEARRAAAGDVAASEMVEQRIAAKVPVAWVHL